MSETKTQDLHTGKPVWSNKRSRNPAFSKLKRNLKTEIAIIGAGISGAMLAEELSAAGFEVALFDKRRPLQRSTSATTALLQYDIDMPLTLLAKKIGKAKATRAWQRSRLVLESLADKISALDIDCDMQRRDSLLLSGDKLDAKGLREEAELRRTCGLPGAYLDRRTLKENYDISRDAALLSFNNMNLNPIKLALGFLTHAVGNGVKIYAPHEVKDVRPLKSGADLILDDGIIVKANHVIFATGYEIPERIRTRRHQINSTWAIATKPQKSRLWPDEAMIWEASDPYLYIRTLPDGRVICGGEDEKFSDEEARDALITKKTRILEKKLKKLFPQLDTKAEFAWTGSFGGSTTGLPSIGRIPGMANCFAVMAYGGNGITFSRMATELIRADLTGNHDPDAALFAFDQ
jgi:glycine/D-amino acid oxidase-like deaminating enzyme